MNALWSTGRLLFSRAILNTITNNVSNSSDVAATGHQQRKTEPEPHLVSAVCGFPKNNRLQRIIKGQFGDDAWFIAKHKTADILGVADGVGGWRAYGLDPGEFSMSLMETCERLVKLGHFTASNPSELIAKGFRELLHHRKVVQGSSTACVVILNNENHTLYTANIGDSGFMVVRNGKLLIRSEEQQHYFNTPFQLSLPPPAHQADVLSDDPDSAITGHYPLEDGDVILVATDGVFDNLPESMIINELIKVQGETSKMRVQMVANTIAFMAKQISQDEEFVTPFCRNAQLNGISTIGGKPDDITVLLATVSF